ncbi:MAG: 50S ribosome-binding GTPase [Clostridium sp.]|uniref:GTPase n=1 Tax=Clostridium sp. TaxID=1506 RepID=UPI0025BDAAB6|nr:GTPase [Clostridium sp.]MCE5221174.1 50S ribosome-binding GTPase [Clostridium sp.]
MEGLIFSEINKKIDNVKDRLEHTINDVYTNKHSFIEEYINDSNTLNKKNKFNVAFIGQYSAGKSSIISAITENSNIRIGQNVTTDKAKEYEWNDIILIDTPGIHTENSEHDEISYRHMDLADLLVYVVTTQGFDDLIAKDFRKIAFEKNKYYKMMLVINKTSLESINNKPNWENDVKKVIQPLKLSDFRVTFIDAKDYLEGLIETNEEDKKELIEMSNFHEVINSINEFVYERGILGRLLSKLNVIETHFTKVLNDITTEDSNIKIQELLTRKKFLVSESKRLTEQKINTVIDNSYNEIIQLSNRIIDKISSDFNVNELEYELEEAKMKIDTLCEKCVNEIEEILDYEIDNLIKKINQLENTALYKDILNDFNAEIDVNVNLSEKQDLTKIKKSPDALKNISKFLGVSGNGIKSWCTNSDAVEKGIKALAGSDAHKFVLKVGSFFGKKFKPYEAVKIAGKIGKAGEVLSKVGKGVGVVGALVAPVIAFYDEYEEDKYEDNIKNARIQTRDNFRTLANDIRKNFNEAKKDIVKNIYEKELNNIEYESNSLRNKDIIKSKNAQELIEIQEEIKEIVNEINKNS